jgi:hypothetical protein
MLNHMRRYVAAVALSALGITVADAVMVGAATQTHTITLCAAGRTLMYPGPGGSCAPSQTPLFVASGTDLERIAQQLDDNDARDRSQDARMLALETSQGAHGRLLDLALHPELAFTWRQSPDGLHWAVQGRNLRPGSTVFELFLETLFVGMGRPFESTALGTVAADGTFRAEGTRNCIYAVKVQATGVLDSSPVNGVETRQATCATPPPMIP